MLSVYSCTAACPVRHIVPALHAAWGWNAQEGFGGERRIKGEAYFWNVGTGEMHGELHVLVVAGLLSFVTKHA